MQIQISSIKNGFLIASPTIPTKDQQKMYNTEQLQQIASQPQVHFCEDYESVCTYIKVFFFSPDKN